MRIIPCLLAPIMLTACVSGPDYEPPAAPGPKAGYGADQAPGTALGEGPAQQWWTAFGSPELDELVGRAIANNQSLAASKATLESARERLRAIAGKRLPQIDANARADYQQVNLSAIGLAERLNSANIGNPEFDLYTVGGGISYDPDLFGRNRRMVEKAEAQAEAARHETEAAHLIIAGRVVSQALAIAALNDRIATENALLAEDERNLSLTETRHKAGAGTMVEVLSAEGQLANDKANMPALEQLLAEERSMLAILLGVTPAELGPTDYTLEQFALPDAVPVALPSALVRKRPDILQAEASLHAAVAAIGVATAELYPNVTLGASITQSSSQPDRIFDSRFNAFDIFAGLTAPIFHGGTLKARKRGAEADARAAAASYKQVVLEAFGQVSGLLSAMQTDRDTLAARQAAAGTAERSLHLSRRSFQVGNSGILQVLDQSRNYQRAKIELLNAKARQYQNVARLYVATAGGWLEPTKTALNQAD